jgi:hypothetical protein
MSSVLHYHSPHILRRPHLLSSPDPSLMCAEINGCAVEPSPCDINADCFDDPPPSTGATCRCKDGYIGEGTPNTCVGKFASLVAVVLPWVQSKGSPTPLAPVNG